MKLINRQKLEDIFYYGENDKAILGDHELDQKVLYIIRQQDTIKAVPYCRIARTILKIRKINPNFDCIPRKEVIDLLWKLIDGKEAADESDISSDVWSDPTADEEH